MQKSALIVLVLATLAVVGNAEIHAVLCAGSKSYSNYRHQSDVCHAYQILINNGIPAANIITMVYNDIADSPSNPYPGQIFNAPTAEGTPGNDVYSGCVIDYEGDDVNPDNYLAVITGNASGVTGGNGRVLSSGPNDDVFLNFVDHGEPGAIDFPEFGDKIYADQLNEAFDTMTTKGLFGQLTYYLETCYSGSIFQSTKTNTNIYAVSAANPNESSWGCYCGPSDDIVDGKKIGSCLGDLFSVNWMENTEQSNTNLETLQQQWEKVKDLTEQSDVMQWGDVSFTSEPISTFLGNSKSSNNFLSKMNRIFNTVTKQTRKASQSAQSVSDIETNYLLARYQENSSTENFENLTADLNKTQTFNAVFEKFNKSFPISGVNNHNGSTNFECYRYLTKVLESQHGYLNDFSKHHMLSLYNFCADKATVEFKHVTF